MFNAIRLRRPPARFIAKLSQSDHHWLRLLGLLSILTMATALVAATVNDAVLMSSAPSPAVLSDTASGDSKVNININQRNQQVSADGRFVVFVSNAKDLIPGQDTAGFNNVFLYDAQTGGVSLISHVPGQPTTGGGHDSSAPVISSDGNVIAYESKADNLIGECDFCWGTSNIYRAGRTGDSQLVSHVPGDPAMPGDSHSTAPVISGDGSVIAYQSLAPDLVIGFVDGNGFQAVDVYRATGTSDSALVSHAAGLPATGGNGVSESPVISGNGSVIAYTSKATNLVSGCTNCGGNFRSDIYRAGLIGDSVLVSHAAGLPTTRGDSDSFLPAISSDGSVIAYVSFAINLVSGFVDGNGSSNADIYRVTGTSDSTLVSHVFGTTTMGGNSFSALPAISSDGSVIAYQSAASDLEASVNDANAKNDVLYYKSADASNRYISRIDPNAPPSAGNGGSTVNSNGTQRSQQVSADGRYAVFVSNAGNLIPNQNTAGFSNVFLYDAQTGAVSLISHVPGQFTMGGDNDSLSPVISSDGSVIAYESYAGNLVVGFVDGNGSNGSDIYRASRTGDSVLVSHVAGSAAAGGNSASISPVISSDGSVIAYQSKASDLVSGCVDCTNTNIYRAGSTGDSVLVSHAAGAATSGGNGNSEFPVISNDGSMIAYASGASNLVNGCANCSPSNVYRAGPAGDSVLVSHAAGLPTTGGNNFSALPAISGDGSVIAYVSVASDLIGSCSDCFTANIYRAGLTGDSELVSHAAGSPTTSGNSFSFSMPAISNDGSVIAYESFASNLVSGFVDSNGPGQSDVYRAVGTSDSELVSHVAGTPVTGGNGNSLDPVISSDGNVIAYQSYSIDLVSGCLDCGRGDIFRVVGTSDSELVSHAIGAPTAGGNEKSESPLISANGVAIVFTSRASNLSNSDLNVEKDAYYFSATSGTGGAGGSGGAGGAGGSGGSGGGAGGVAGAPAFSIDPTSHDFGEVPLTTSSAAKTLTISNTGTAPLRVDTVALSNDPSNDFAISNDGCTGQSLTTPTTCTVQVTFSPTAAGARSANLSILTNDTTSPHSVALSGMGTQPGLSLSASTLSFGGQRVGTTSNVMTLTLTNTGGAPLRVGVPSIGGTNAADFKIETNGCTADVAATQSCSLTVSFKPDVEGARTASLSIPSNASTTAASVDLSGTGTLPGISASPSPADFGSVTVGATSDVLDITLTNTGQATLLIATTELTGAEFTEVTNPTDPCRSASVAPGQSCKVKLTFTPSDVGSRTGKLSIASDATTTPLEVTLTGTGVRAGIQASPSPANFSDTVVGQDATPVVVTVTNNGTAPLSVMQAALSGADKDDFSITANTCGSATVAINATCEITLGFRPTVKAVRSATLQLTSNAAVTTHDVTVTGTGVQAAMTPPTTLDLGERDVGVKHTQPVEITNTGSAPLEVSKFELTGDSDFTTDAGTCTGPLQPAAKCTANLHFQPIAEGARTAVLKITSNAQGGPHSITLTGTGKRVVIVTPPSTGTGGASGGGTGGSTGGSTGGNAPSGGGFPVTTGGTTPAPAADPTPTTAPTASVSAGSATGGAASATGSGGCTLSPGQGDWSWLLLALAGLELRRFSARSRIPR